MTNSSGKGTLPPFVSMLRPRSTLKACIPDTAIILPLKSLTGATGPLLPESVSMEKPRETFEPWRSPRFAPDGSRYLSVSTSSPRVSTSMRSKWASVSALPKALRSGSNKRAEYLGHFKGKRAPSYLTMLAMSSDTACLLNQDRGLWLALLRWLTATSIEEACERAQRALQSHPQLPWSVALAERSSQSSRGKLQKYEEVLKNFRQTHSSSNVNEIGRAHV